MDPAEHATTDGRQIRCVGSPADRGGWGCLEPLRGWRILDLHGTDEQIGRIYGTLLYDELVDSWGPMVHEMHWDRVPPVFAALLRRHDRHYASYFDVRAADRARGLESAIGAPPGSFRRTSWLTDLASIGPSLQLALAGTVQMDGLTGEVGDRCTTIVGRYGEATVQARNLDFWGMGFWQKHATLVFVEPLTTDGFPDGLRYAHVGTVGELFAGSSGVNEAGLAVTSHLHVTRDVALVGGRMRMSSTALLWEGITGRHDRSGESIHVLFESVLRDASTVPEAIEVLRRHRPVGAWSFVVSDPSGDRAVIATDALDFHVSRGASVDTNFYLDPAMHARELNPARGPVEGALLRFQRAAGLLDAAGPELTPEEAVDILRDRFDAGVQEVRAVSPNTVASPDTSQAVVFVTSPGRAPVLWLADPHADDPYEPAPFAPFASFDFGQGFRPGRQVGGEIPFVDDPELARVGAAYRDAMRLAIDEADRPGAAAALRRIETDDAGIRLMAAWASASVGELSAAEAALATVRRESLSYQHRALHAWLQGELLRASGDEVGARAAWQRGLAGLDDTGPSAALDGPLRAVLQHRASGGKSGPLPFPDLKFQDIIELRTPGRPHGAR